MPIARMHDGHEVIFPDGTSDEVINSFALKYTANTKKQDDNSGFLNSIMNMFSGVNNRIDNIKPAAAPEVVVNPIINTGTDMSKVEAGLDVIAAKIPTDDYRDEFRAIKSALDGLTRAIAAQGFEHHADRIVKAVEENAPDNSPLVKQFKDGMADLGKAIRISHANMMDQNATSNKATVAGVEKSVKAMAKGLIEAMRAPREVVTDKKTGKPIGVKIKVD